ncbi:uncharacterized protein LOC107371835 isoform X2 [Tetranychus urticae]|uniref:BTB domain-containing protein n=1 Tax=Tetranychus urticae TaxID=32264 RepID=T1JY92_TETUR|nr:uncharacterized protein LOC107371835 isoform X2 [Tetranychus urticae]
MDSLETADQITIVNRSSEHRISKNLIRRIPYFEKLLSYDYLESRENKVELDFDEKAFKWLLNWIEFGDIFIEMDYVINLSNMADYFGLKDQLEQDCARYFRENFSSQHLPSVIPQVTSTTKYLNSGYLSAFICRYFLKISNKTVWLDYPFETIEYICALDLMIHSEYQVFDAIVKWVSFKTDSRKCHLENLLKLVRWCNLEGKYLSKVKENELIVSYTKTRTLLSLFISRLCSHDKTNCNCNIDRTKQGCFVVIEELDDKNSIIKVLDSNFLPLVNQVMQSDESLPLHFFHGKYASDISFESGRKMIRIDWKRNKYRLYDFQAYKLHCLKMLKCISDKQQSESWIVQTQTTYASSAACESAFLEVNDKFLVVHNELDNFRFLENPSALNFNLHAGNGDTYMATILDDSIYMLTNKLEFFQFNIERKLEFKKIEIRGFEVEFNFKNLFLTSKQVNDDRVIIVDKIKKGVFCLNVSTQKCKSMGRIIDCKSKSTDGQKESNVLKTFTFGFISMDSSKLYLKRKSTK